MRIAFFHELEKGGARKSVNEIAKILKKNNTVDIYCISNFFEKDEKKNFSNAYLFSFDIKKWQGGNWKARIYKDTFELYQLNKLHKKIALAINEKKYDVVLVHPSVLIQAPFILKYIKIPTVYYCQEPLRIVYDQTVRNLISTSTLRNFYDQIILYVRKRIDKENINSAKYILANSCFSKIAIKHAYGKEAKVMYLGVNTEVFKPRNIRKQYDVLFLGSKDRIDGYDILEKLKTGLKGKIYVIESYAKDIHEEDIVVAYNKARLVICLSRNEPFGLIPLEAMSCGVPVIAIDSGGYKETIKHGETGYLVENSPKKICFYITKLLQDDDLYNSFSKNARKHVVQEWQWDLTARNLLVYFNSLLTK